MLFFSCSFFAASTAALAASWIIASKLDTSALLDSIVLDSSAVCVLYSSSRFCNFVISDSRDVFRSSTSWTVSAYSRNLSRSYVCTFSTYSVWVSISEILPEATIRSNAEVSPSSYMYLIRSFISSYCCCFFSSATARSSWALVISCPLLISCVSRSFVFVNNSFSCAWRPFTSFWADSFWFWRLVVSSGAAITACSFL